MNFGTLATFAKKEITQVPPPFPAGAANNGLSVDLATGDIVLGNDLGDATQPAGLVSDRVIPYIAPGVSIFFGDPGAAHTSVTPTTMQGTNAAGDQQWQSTPGRFTASDASGSFPKVDLITPVCNVSFLNEDGLVRIQASPFHKELRVDLVNLRLILGATGSPDNGASLQMPGPATINGGIGSGNAMDIFGPLNTDAPTGGVSAAGAIEFGSIVAGAVALDATRYWELNVNGAVIKVLIAP